MSREPKYKLNKRDAQRWHDLLVRHCLECPPRPGEKPRSQRSLKKWPPLTPEENAEFEALSAKRSRKIESHPLVKASIRRSRRQCRELEKLVKKLNRLVNRAKRNARAKGVKI